MCGPAEKSENKTKIEKLINAIEKLSRQLEESKPSERADKLKAQIDRLEKLIG